MKGDLENKGSLERQLAEQLQNYERQLTEKTAAADQLQRQHGELRAQFDSTQEDKDKKKLVMINFYVLYLLLSKDGNS